MALDGAGSFGFCQGARVPYRGGIEYGLEASKLVQGAERSKNSQATSKHRIWAANLSHNSSLLDVDLLLEVGNQGRSDSWIDRLSGRTTNGHQRKKRRGCPASNPAPLQHKNGNEALCFVRPH
ncbi:hypothetical protein WJX74_005671 [Apatococcus lobatus]|uniref:Uncharacterized protein n=1 Tax=Apatococcus lobatus TaxID=904363 RepID=A0AAW1SBK7_9CHLO